MDTNDKPIAINIMLSEQEKQICKASFNEVTLYYLVNPMLFLSYIRIYIYVQLEILL